jgi:uncharacterized lipoprotein YajG
MKSCLRIMCIFIATALLAACAGAKTTPSLSDFDDVTPPNQDAINKLEAGTTY